MRAGLGFLKNAPAAGGGGGGGPALYTGVWTDGIATVASWGLRRVVSTWSGPLIVTPGPNTVGCAAGSDLIDTATVAAQAVGGTLHVSRLYDQSNVSGGPGQYFGSDTGATCYVGGQLQGLGGRTTADAAGVSGVGNYGNYVPFGSSDGSWMCIIVGDVPSDANGSRAWEAGGTQFLDYDGGSSTISVSGGGFSMSHAAPKGTTFVSALTFDGSKVEWYFNGVLFGSQNTTTAGLTGNPSGQIGYFWGAPLAAAAMTNHYSATERDTLVSRAKDLWGIVF